MHALNYSCVAGLPPQTNAAVCSLETFVVHLNLLFLLHRKTEFGVNVSKSCSLYFALYLLRIVR